MNREDLNDDHIYKNIKPRIIKLIPKKNKDDEITDFENEDLNFLVSNEKFEINQNSRIEILDDLMELTVLQSVSTPGMILKKKIRLNPGKYIMTIVGYSQYGRTFFPWVRDTESKKRLSETIHLSHIEEPIEVNFRVKETTIIQIGVLSHRQQIGDKCFIRSLHISKKTSQSSFKKSSSDRLKINFDDLVPHHETRIKVTNNTAIVKSSSYSTPGVYFILDVSKIKILSISISAVIKPPSTAFLYVADSLNGDELSRRNYILESDDKGSISNLFAAVKVPKGTKKIRLGILFSKSENPTGHQMEILKIDVTEHRKISDYVDQIYLLNLKDDNDKYLICKRQSEKFGFELTKWDAVDGMSKENYSQWLKYMEQPWTEQDKFLNRKSIDKPGAWGYLLSMKSIFEDAIAKNHESILVFDDDFILSSYFDHNFSKFIKKVPSNWEIIYLGASQWSWDSVDLINDSFYLANSDTNGTFAVMYKKSTFSRLISLIKKMNSPFDAGPLRELVLSESSDKSFVAFPNLVIANVQKKGIRDSRNQLDYSRRFRWDLDNFPPHFLTWSDKPIILRDESDFIIGKNKTHFVTAVTTVNRLNFLKNFVHSWNETRNQSHHHTLIFADDGSTDGTLSWLTSELYIEDVRIIVIQNDGRGIARQSNSILDKIATLKYKPDLIFMCNDDINFKKKGWDDVYFDSVKKSLFEHLVYFNPNWKKPIHDVESDIHSFLHSNCSILDAMGCFYTLTPELIKKVGFFDEKSFPIRGHSHLDYTMRICRNGGNVAANIFDVKNSNDYVGMILRDEYIRTNRILSVKEILLLSSEEEIQNRFDLISKEDRNFVEKGW